MSAAAGRHRAAWERARARYPASGHLPLPRWATRGYAETPAAAWDALRSDAGRSRGPLSIYVHLPFCATRCPFCDCHATRVPSDGGDIVERYLAVLAHEVVSWASIRGLAERPVTTVHFGGGTPLALGTDAFGGVACALRDALGTHEGTEWALETTSRTLDADALDALDRLGFTRIHVGVQSLDPDQRRLLGRREPPATVIERIRACRERGWVVSADLLYGLPGQTSATLAGDIEQLAGAGIQGVSLYHLNAGPHNAPFVRRHGLDARGEARLAADFSLMAEAAETLRALGFGRNHVTHFALPADENRYARHALRGEDLLALGSSADGVIGDRFYRHVEVDAYAAAPSGVAATDVPPPLEGAGVFTPAERRARPLVTRLMSAEVDRAGLDARSVAFSEGLVADGLLEPVAAGWRLTDAGAWFAGAITAEAWELYATTTR